jgi:hypothetical protein
MLGKFQSFNAEGPAEERTVLGNRELFPPGPFPDSNME